MASTLLWMQVRTEEFLHMTKVEKLLVGSPVKFQVRCRCGLIRTIRGDRAAHGVAYARAAANVRRRKTAQEIREG
jgi:hypothetical protein